MVRYGMVIDLGKCVGCSACVAACIVENMYKQGIKIKKNKLTEILSKFIDLPNPREPPVLEAVERVVRRGESPEKVFEHLLWTRTKVIRLELGNFPNVEAIYYHKICQHCDDAPCVSVCPTQASYQTKEGVVLIDPNKCILCGACITACPYGARSVNPFANVVDKCTFCYHRLKEGKLPACVETCPTGARVFGDLDDPNSEVSKLARESVRGTPFGPMPRSEPRVYYRLPRKRS